MLLTDSGNTFEAAPAGVHPARLFRILDLGTQESTYQGQIKHGRKIMLSFELLGDDRMSDGKPFTISRRFTASLGEKSALRPFLESWRGKRYQPDELRAGLRLDKMLAQHCLLTLIESERDGKTYTNISGISNLPKSMPKPEGINPPQLFDLAAPDWNVFDALSDKMAGTILMSPEGQAAQKARHAKPPKPELFEREPGSDDDLDDDIAF